MSQAYVYQPLIRRRQFRLVFLNADLRKPHGLALSLLAVNLDHNLPPFWALSYTWGSAEVGNTTETTYDLDCDGTVISVKENLFEYLCQAIRAERRPLPIWIDAVCINQEDIAERSEQVAMMGEIYKRAARVVVWLGKSEPHADVVWASKTFAPALSGILNSDRDIEKLRNIN